MPQETLHIEPSPNQVETPAVDASENAQWSKEEMAIRDFDATIASVRIALGKAGHLELLTSEEYREAVKKLTDTIGKKNAETHLSHWFDQNFGQTTKNTLNS